MSRYWGYYCQDCGISSPHWLNHGKDILARMYTHRFILVQAYPILQACDIEVSQLGVYDSPSPLEFLYKHKDHLLFLESEYGERQLMPCGTDEVRGG